MRTLRECLNSIRDQRYGDIELVVVDNGSTDGTRDVAQELASRIVDAGPERSAQRNAGAAVSSGQYLLFIDSDMVLARDVVAGCVAVAERTGAEGVIVPERSVGTGFWAACKALERSCYVGDDTIEAARFFTREAFELHGGYDEGMTGPEDFDLPARIRAAGGTIARASAEITHLEGKLRLRTTMAKKFYYGRQVGPYLRRHPALARKQLSPLRPAFLRHWRQLARRPLHGAGVVVLKLAEFAAGGAGVLLARLGERGPTRAG